VPEPASVQLDSGGHHYLLLARQADGGVVVSLHHGQGDRRSSLDDAIRAHLFVQVRGPGELNHVHRLAVGTDRFTVPPGARHLLVCLGTDERWLPVGRADLTGPEVHAGSDYKLSPFESRYLADNGRLHPGWDCELPTGGLRTDLHVHLAGCVSGADLVRIGVETGARYPAGVLAEAGIRVEPAGPAAAADGAAIALADLAPHLRDHLAGRLEVAMDRQITFLDMERIYRLRGPVTKHAPAFVPLLRQVAQDYAGMGVTYAELSVSNIIEADRLRAAHRELPAVEGQAGVTLRFLAALSRHDDLEWDLDAIDRLCRLARSRYIVGVDFMGHETNSTRAFARQLREVAVRMGRLRPGFVVRVHAGENPAHPENVRVAVECVAGTGARLRIGHGLFGADDATLALLKSVGAIVEFNLNSNFALNNVQSARDVPLRRYLAAGVPVVLGTDGYGIYQTSAELEARAGALCGLTARDLAAIRDTEARYVRERTAADEAHTDAPGRFIVPDDAPSRHFTPEVARLKREAAERRDAALADRLRVLGVPVLEGDRLADLLAGRQCVSFAGAWRKSWDCISPANQKLVRGELARLLDALDPAATVLVTGGTHYGVEHVVHTLARPRGFTVLGTLVKQTPPESIAPGSITQAALVGETLHDKAAGLYALVAAHRGLCLFIGGGNVVSDEIQTAANLRLRYLLMDGPEGASTDHARQQPRRAFRTAAEVVEALRGGSRWTGNDPYWHVGPNPTVDVVVTRDAPGGGGEGSTGVTREVLLVRRDPDAPCEARKWALPGGFVLTDAPRGTPWQPGKETLPAACVRELREETGLDVRELESRLVPVGTYEGNGRDPRDTPTAWCRSSAFALHLPPALASLPLAGGDDACDARWFGIDDAPRDLAFDHERILADALAKLHV
jgi:ADP-ribose pyrophosphatase YjhB (NUDIX family)